MSRVAASVENAREEPAAETQPPAEPAPAATPVEASQSPVNIPAPPDETHWYSFWNPFRSEIAASGFVSQLERVTGIDYRIVKVETGVYEVAFAYLDDAERRDKLSRIAAATGLDLPDSR